jgi:hypothetical protein
MAKRKRWGKKYEDKRDWKATNRELIKRGEYYINPSFLETWIDEINEMNKGKIGQPFLYPVSLIVFLAVLYAKGFDFRSLQGIVTAFSKRFNNFPIICFSQIRRRIRDLPKEFYAKAENLIVGSDGTGIKVTNRGEWIRHKWAIKRGWVKVIILGDIDGNIIDIRIGEEYSNENTAARDMVLVNNEKINSFLGDGLYDTKENFRLLDQLGIAPVIKIRKNAITKADGCTPRKKQVLEYQKWGYKKWAKKKKYGQRWLTTEGIFSAVKRINGETLRAHTKKGLYDEAQLKFWAYQAIRDAGKAQI